MIMSIRSLKTLGMLFWVLFANFLSVFSNVIQYRGKTNRLLKDDEATVGEIVSFRLIDADTNQPLMNIINNQVINLPIPGSKSFNIDVMTADGPVGSVLFGYLGDDDYRLESKPPFAVCGDDWRTQDYYACPRFTSSNYRVVATPYSETYAKGIEGASVTLIFSITTSSSPTFAPVGSPTNAPIIAPTTAPRKAPTSAPRRPPTRAPTKAPIKPATVAPRNAPTVAPLRPTTNTPTRVPNSVECAKPKFVDDSWQDSGPRYPIRRVSEPEGLLVGNDIVIFSGFTQNLSIATNQTYARNVLDDDSPWRRMDDMPMYTGITHAAVSRIGTKIYICGGYLGGHPGPHVPNCFVYDHSVLPGNQQWSHFTPLPNGGSAGGGMIYDSARDALFYTGGGQRRIAGNVHPVDIDNTWKFHLNNPNAGWVASTPFPYLANHVSYVTHTDGLNRERHFFLGGQVGEVECCANFGLNYEFIASSETWVRRSSMPIPRGHASSSTRAIGCGFIIAGGSINSATTSKNRTNDISYYDIPTNTWTARVGLLPASIATPVVDIHSNGYMYFVSGLPDNGERRISV